MFGSDESTLKIIIDAENRAKAILSDAQDDLKGFGKSFEETAKGFRQFGVGITAVGVGLGGLLVATGLTAARVEVLNTVMENVGRVSGVSSDTLKEQERIIKKLGITTKEAKETLILFMQGQLDVTEASKIARVAQDLAVIAGVNSSEATRTLTQAIISQQPMLLRNFGIVQNLNDVYLAYGKEIGIVTENIDKNGKVSSSWARDLTDIEKRQAMLNMILTEGAKVTGTYEAAMGDAGKQLTSLPRYIDEAKLAFGTAFIPVIGFVVEKLTELLKAFTSLSPETMKMITYITMGVAAFTLILGPILLLIGFLPAIAAGFAILLGPVGAVILAVTALTAAGVILYLKWDEVKNFFKLTWEGIKIIFSEAITWIIGRMQPLIDIFEKIKSAISWVKTATSNVGASVGSLSDLLYRTMPKFQQGGIVPGQLGVPVLATVHGGERIIPAGKSGSGNIYITLTGNTFMSDEEAAEKIGDRIIRILKMQNRFAY